MRLDLWYCQLDDARDPALLEQYRQWLPDDERAEEDRYRFEAGKLQVLVSRVLVRWALSARTGIDPARWRFTRNPYGKPAVAEPNMPGLEFNLTHTHGLAACLVGQQAALGLDAEDLMRSTSGLDLARRFFARDEVAALESAEEEDRHRLFFTFWTLKEAFIKGRGLGMSLPLEAFAFDLRPGCPPRVDFAPSDDEQPEAWQFARLSLGPRWALALAVRRPASEPLELWVHGGVPLLDSPQPLTLSPTADATWVLPARS